MEYRVVQNLDPNRPHELFDAAWYVSTYPGVTTTDDAWQHFLSAGEREGRSPGPEFDAEFYRTTFLALNDERSLTHFVLEGDDLGFTPRAFSVLPAPSASALQAALDGRENPIVFLGNDARAAGGPLLLLELARQFHTRGYTPIFILKQAGPLYTRYNELGPTLIADVGWSLPAFGAAIPAETPIVANTVWGAYLAARMRVSQRTIVLTQEMPSYMKEHQLLEDVRQAHTIVASMPGVQTQLVDLFERNSPENERTATTEVLTIIPGLYPPRISAEGAVAIRAELDERFGASATLYLGAGYGDQRKGFDLFLETAEKIYQRDANSGFVWLGELGSWGTRLAHETQERGLPLLLPGFRRDAGDWYAAVDVYLLTSRQDPGPTTVLDAAAIGVPFVGIAADIGIRDVPLITPEVGEFVGDTTAMAERAIAVAQDETPARRDARATYISTARPFERYVDDIEALVKETATSRAAQARGTQLRLAKVLVAESLGVGGVSRKSVGEKARVLARRAPRTTSLLKGLGAERLAAVGLADGPTPGTTSEIPSLIAGPMELSRLRPNDRVWLAQPALLHFLRTPSDVHLMRGASDEPWELVAAVERASRSIARLTQYDTHNPPRWVGQLTPPRPRRRPVPAPRLHAATSLAPVSAVEVARPIGVFIHAYYPELLPVITDRLAHIEHPLHVYVSTDTESKADEIRRVAPEATVRLFPNRGRDIAPKIYGFAPEHAEHDIVLHLHTKRSPHRQDLSGWLTYLLDCLVASPEHVNAIIALLSQTNASQRTGLVSPTPFPTIGIPQWGPNRAIAEVVTWGKGWPVLPDDYRLKFPAGSMFWARAAALRPVQELAIPFEAFSETPAVDGTLAHAIERLIGVSAMAAGFDHTFVGPQR